MFNLFFPFGKSEGFHKSKVLHKSYLLLYLALSSSFDCHDSTTWSDTNFLSWILIMISSRGNFYFGYYEPVFSMKMPSSNHLIKNKSVFGLKKWKQQFKILANSSVVHCQTLQDHRKIWKSEGARSNLANIMCPPAPPLPTALNNEDFSCKMLATYIPLNLLELLSMIV